MTSSRDGDEAAQPDPTPPGREIVEAQAGAVATRSGYGPVGYGGYGVSEDEGDFASSLRWMLGIALKHKWLVIGMTCAAIALGGLITLMQTPQYSAMVRVQVERDAAKVVEGGNTAPTETGNSTEFLRTQYELLKSRGMAERVAAALRLAEDESFTKPRPSLLGLLISLVAGRGEEPGADDVTLQAVTRLEENTLVMPVTGSRLIDLTYSDPDPKRAQRIANAFADAYVASNLDKRFEANAYAKTFLEDQIKQLKIRLEDSERAMLEFAKQEQIVEVNEKSSIAESNLAAANTALGQLVSERIKNEQLYTQVKDGKVLDLPQFLTNSVIDGLRGQRKELMREYQEKLETFKPGYPAMVQIRKKIAEIDRQLANEADTIRSSLKAGYESSLSQEEEMKKRIEELRSAVLDLQKRTVRYNILKREVETNRGLYNNLLQRYKEVDIAGGVGTNNIFIVDRAIEPKKPSSPRLGRSLLLSLMLGLGGGLGFAYLLEVLDDRLRGPEELEELTGLATLGVIPKIHASSDISQELRDPRSAVSEAYRSLATALQFSTERGLPRSLAVTSSGPSEGKSSTALALARQFASMGLKVLLVDVDLRKPSLHLKLGLDNAVGLSNYLTGAAQPPELIQATELPNLAVISSGPLPPNAADLLAGTRMFSLVSVGLEVFDVIVMDSPPLLGLADAALISSAVSGTVFVVGAGEQPKGAVRAALKRLTMARGTVRPRR